MKAYIAVLHQTPWIQNKSGRALRMVASLGLGALGLGFLVDAIASGIDNFVVDKFVIPRSRHDPKILWVDDAKIVGDRITEVRPIPGNFFTQETERRIGELGASCIAFVVRDVSVHQAP